MTDGPTFRVLLRTVEDRCDQEGILAERVGFEPTIPVKVCPLSRRIVSTTHAPLRVGQIARRSLSGQMTTTPVIPKRSEESAFLATHPQPAAPRLLPTISKERLQHFRAAPSQYPTSN